MGSRPQDRTGARVSFTPNLNNVEVKVLYQALITYRTLYNNFTDAELEALNSLEKQLRSAAKVRKLAVE